MKKTLSLLLIAAVLFSIVSCASGQQTAIGTEAPSSVPTEAPTEAPTAAPTPEPTEAPTEEPTPKPTPIPEPVELVFDECAELVCRLPWGRGDLQVYFEDPDESEGIVPQDFFIADGKVYVYDRYMRSGMGFLIYDIGTGELSRLSVESEIDYEIWTRFAVLDGKLVGHRGVFDLVTGEQYRLQPIFQSSTEPQYLRYFQIRDGKLYAYVGYIRYYDEDELSQIMEYEFDLENRMWVQTRKILYSGGQDYLVIKDGGFRIRRGCYLGFDNEGNHYVQCFGAEGYGEDRTYYYAILKYSPDGYLVSSLKFNYYEDFGEKMMDGMPSQRFSCVTEDGTVWLMFPLKGGLRIYKVDMG